MSSRSSTRPSAAASSSMSSNSRLVRSMLWPPTNAWKRSERISTSPAFTGLVAALLALRRRRLTTLCVRAITSSGWQGLVIQSSAPRRRPRTRWATVDGPVHTTMPNSGRAPHSRSSQAQAWGPSTARSTTRALRRIDTTASVGTGLASTRCSQPSRSRRLLRTWMNPLSRSSTAMRSDAEAGAEESVAGAEESMAGRAAPRSSARTLAVIGAECRRSGRCAIAAEYEVTGSSQPLSPRLEGARGAGGVRELPEQARHHEGDLLADIDGVVADSLQGAGDEGHVHRPLARVRVVADLDRHAEDLPVEAVDLPILANEVLGQ